MARADEALDRERMTRTTEGLATNAAKIRALFREGFSKSAIRAFLGIGYQQVYNVIKRSGLEESASAYGDGPQYAWERVGPAGRISIPAAFLGALGLREGDDVQLHLADKELRIVSKAVAIARVQALVRQHVPDGVSLVDELIAERRREAAADEESP